VALDGAELFVDEGAHVFISGRRQQALDEVAECWSSKAEGGVRRRWARFARDGLRDRGRRYRSSLLEVLDRGVDFEVDQSRGIDAVVVQDAGVFEAHDSMYTRPYQDRGVCGTWRCIGAILGTGPEPELPVEGRVGVGAARGGSAPSVVSTGAEFEVTNWFATPQCAPTMKFVGSQTAWRMATP